MSLREVRHRAAQRLVVEAAFDLMLQRGYAGTTMTAVAEHAGVAERTVYNLFGSKVGLMLATLQGHVMGDESDGLATAHERMRTLNDPMEIIDVIVEANHRVANRALPLFRVAYQAAAVEPEIATALAEQEEFRFNHQGEMVDVLAEKGFLRDDVPYELLKRGFWLVAGPESVIKAMDAGWDLDAFSAWLRALLPRFLLAD